LPTTEIIAPLVSFTLCRKSPQPFASLATSLIFLLARSRARNQAGSADRTNMDIQDETGNSVEDKDEEEEDQNWARRWECWGV